MPCKKQKLPHQYISGSGVIRSTCLSVLLSLIWLSQLSVLAVAASIEPVVTQATSKPEDKASSSQTQATPTTKGSEATAQTTQSPQTTPSSQKAPTNNDKYGNPAENAGQKDPVSSTAVDRGCVSVSRPDKDDSANGGDAPRKKKNDFLDVLPCLTWVDPDQEQKAVLLCVHGLGLNNRSYEEFGKRMAKLGYLVYAVDVPGFGSFQGADLGRDRIDFDYCLKGIADTLKLVHKVNRKMPVYMLGESMGGAIALRVTAENPGLVDGLISSVPSGDRFKQNKQAFRVGLKLLTAPNKPFDIGTDVIKQATQDDKLRKDWADDPANRMNLTPKELLRFQGFMNDNHECARNITTTPVLFVQGCKDMLVRPEGTQELFNNIGSTDRQIELIRDKEHLIFEEGQFDDQVIEIVDTWLASHIKTLKLTKS